MAVQDQLVTDQYAAYLGDCIEVMSDLPDESVHPNSALADCFLRTGDPRACVYAEA